MKKLTKTIICMIAIFAMEKANAQATNGKVGINTETPTETLDVLGRTRIRVLPKQDSQNSISTSQNGEGQPIDNQYFSANSIIVADNNGVLGKMVGQNATNKTTSEEYNNSESMFVIRRYKPGDAILSGVSTGMSSEKWVAIMGGGSFFEYTSNSTTPNVFPKNGSFGWYLKDNKKEWVIMGEINAIIEEPIIDILFINKKFVMAEPRR